MTSSNIKFTENAQQQTLISIQSLQNLEKELYSNLEKLSAENASSEMQQIIINRINDISQTRIALFQQLQAMYLTQQESVSDKRNELVDQLTLVNIVEGELDNAKSQINTIKDSNANNLRMTEINTYYSKRYKAHSKIMKYIILLCIPLLVLALLSKRYIITSDMAKILGTIIIIVGIYFILPLIVDLYYRDNMVFDEYQFPFNPKGLPEINARNKQPVNPSDDVTNLCVGSACCSNGMIYNDDQEKCVLANNSISRKGSVVTEPYVNNMEFVTR